MVGIAFSAAFADVWAAMTAIQLYCSLNLQPEASTTTTTTTSPAQTSVSFIDFQILLTLIAAGCLYAAMALVYRSLHQAEAAAAAAAGAGGGDRRPSDLVAFIFAAAGILQFFLFVGDVGAVGVAAAHVLPAASIATFFIGMVLMIIVHIRAGGEGGGGEEAIQAPVWIVTKIAFAAAAGLVTLMTIALCAKY